MMPPAPVAWPHPVAVSPRLRLARVALGAALVVPDVLGAEAGPQGMRVTADPPAGLIRGVSVIAQADGRYAVDLCLVASVVPLVALGEQVRRRVQASARRDGLADQLGTVNVEFARLLMPEEARRESEGARGAAGAGAAPAASELPYAASPGAPAVRPPNTRPCAERVPDRAPTDAPRPLASAPPARPSREESGR